MNTLTAIECPSIYLEPLQLAHYDSLYNIAQDESIWAFTRTIALGLKFQDWFNKALEKAARGEQLPFVVVDQQTHQLLGTTRIYDIDNTNRKCAIGYTWYIRAVWGTKVNPQAKFLLLSHAFEQLNFNRVEFHTDSRNLRSCKAILKLGAKHEGTLRFHLINENGYLRDTEVYSIIKTEWPDVRNNLIQRVSAFI
jgi:RimJ/RimL family protein N-acetyltransferase